jgi:hypothetical protein
MCAWGGQLSDSVRACAQGRADEEEGEAGSAAGTSMMAGDYSEAYITIIYMINYIIII